MVSVPGVQSNEEPHAPFNIHGVRVMVSAGLNPATRKKPARSTTTKPATAKKPCRQLKSRGLKNSRTKNNIKDKLIVRLATAEDIETTRAIGRAMHEKTVFTHTPSSNRIFDRQRDGIIKLPPDKAGVVVEQNGSLPGFVFLTCDKYYISANLGTRQRRAIKWI